MTRLRQRLRDLRCIVFGHGPHVPGRYELCSKCGHRKHVEPIKERGR